LVKTIKKARNPVRVGMVGKYFETGNFTLMDSYISVIEAVKHACFHFKRKPEIHWLSAENYEPTKFPKGSRQALKNIEKDLRNLDGIIVPGGFGVRGTEGKIKVIEFCRKNNIPYLGLCLGTQLAVVEFARNVCKIKNACSSEFDHKCQNPVIDVMPEQKTLLKEKKYGATMRLGAYKCKLLPDTISHKAYGAGKNKTKRPFIISERHRHRYELNNDYKESLEKKGLIIAGVNPERNLVEIIEAKNHPFFVASQFHPEFKSRPLNPHPLFREFIRTAINKKPAVGGKAKK